jgi:Class II Aldolase and Adducin N-terminal domain
MVKVFAALGESLKPMENFGSLFAPETPVYQRVGLIVSMELGREMAETLGEHQVLIMRGHGSTVVGANLYVRDQLGHASIQMTVDIYGSSHTGSESAGS